MLDIASELYLGQIVKDKFWNDYDRNDCGAKSYEFSITIFRIIKSRIF